jgi:hypothetical protein
LLQLRSTPEIVAKLPHSTHLGTSPITFHAFFEPLRLCGFA